MTFLPFGNPASSSQKPGTRRPKLTPSTVSSPCLSTHAPVAARRDSGSSSPTKASSLLAKVASSPATPRRDSSSSSTQSPSTVEMQSSPLYTPQDQRPGVWRSETARYWKQQDGYISFPDFEKYCQTQNPYDQRQEVQT